MCALCLARAYLPGAKLGEEGRRKEERKKKKKKGRAEKKNKKKKEEKERKKEKPQRQAWLRSAGARAAGGAEGRARRRSAGGCRCRAPRAGLPLAPLGSPRFSRLLSCPVPSRGRGPAGAGCCEPSSRWRRSGGAASRDGRASFPR